MRANLVAGRSARAWPHFGHEPCRQEATLGFGPKRTPSHGSMATTAMSLSLLPSALGTSDYFLIASIRQPAAAAAAAAAAGEGRIDGLARANAA